MSQPNYNPKLASLEEAYESSISKNLTKTEIAEALNGNDEPIIALISDVIESDDSINEGNYSKDEIMRFYTSVTKKVRAILKAQQDALEKEELERKVGAVSGEFMRVIETASKQYSITQLIKFTSNMNVKIDRNEAEMLAERIFKELGTKLHDMVFDIVRDFCKEQKIVPEKSVN